MNSRMAWWIIDQLVQQGVLDFCLAPGSRSTPLALAAAHHKKAKVHVHYDERGLGFYALGIARASNKPVGVIVTSGTAVGNLLPAVMEGYHSHIPLLLLTADRPPDLIHAGANQTCDQLDIFQRFVRGHLHLPTAEKEVSEKYVRSSLAQAVCLSLYPRGPVHVNWHIREPLFTPPFPELEEGKPIRLVAPRTIPSESTELSGLGVIAIGRLPQNQDVQPILELAERLRWPVFADILSEARYFPTENQIFHFDWLLKRGAPSVETILHFGERLTSKAFLSWKSSARRIHVSPWTDLQDEARLLTERVLAECGEFCKTAKIIPAPSSWLEEWQGLDRQIGEQIKEHISTTCTEPSAFHALSKWIQADCSLYLGSGMPIRDANLFFFPGGQRAQARVFSNRGLSGIDGNIATAAGLAEHLPGPLIAWIGDQAALYDLNSLPLLHKTKRPVWLIISNNFGGGIFSHLPIAKTSEHFETLWANAHTFKFASIAEQFGLPYQRVDSLEAFEKVYRALPARSAIIELITSRELNYACHKTLQEIIAYREPRALQTQGEEGLAPLQKKP